MSLLFYVGKRRGYKTFAGAKVRRNFDICKRMRIFLRKMSGSHPNAIDETRDMICRTNKQSQD